jgi:hypothetical protein
MTTQTKRPTKQLWKAYFVWASTPEVDRGDVTTDAAWCREQGVADRTLRRWKQLEEFQEGLQAALDGGASMGEVAAVGDEADYLHVKATLVAGARSGNPKYLDLYFKTYGKPFVEEEAAARSTDLAGLDLDVLVAQALVVLGPAPVAAHLRSLGWRCDAP